MHNSNIRIAAVPVLYGAWLFFFNIIDLTPMSKGNLILMRQSAKSRTSKLMKVAASGGNTLYLQTLSRHMSFPVNFLCSSQQCWHECITQWENLPCGSLLNQQYDWLGNTMKLVYKLRQMFTSGSLDDGFLLHISLDNLGIPFKPVSVFLPVFFAPLDLVNVLILAQAETIPTTTTRSYETRISF